jgi:hypothetical protein
LPCALCVALGDLGCLGCLVCLVRLGCLGCLVCLGCLGLPWVPGVPCVPWVPLVALDALGALRAFGALGCLGCIGCLGLRLECIVCLVCLGCLGLPWAPWSRYLCFQSNSFYKVWAQRCFQNLSFSQGCTFGRSTVSQFVRVDIPELKQFVGLHLRTFNSITVHACRCPRPQAIHWVAFARVQQYRSSCVSMSQNSSTSLGCICARSTVSQLARACVEKHA